MHCLVYQTSGGTLIGMSSSIMTADVRAVNETVAGMKRTLDAVVAENANK
jgi:hypothetical protein